MNMRPALRGQQVTRSGVGAITHSVVKRSVISQAATGTAIAAVAGKRIRILSMFMKAAGAVTVYVADSDALAILGDSSNPMALAANDDLTLPTNSDGWCETGVGKSLDLILGGSISVGGSLVYVEV